MSAFSLPISPVILTNDLHGLTERSATIIRDRISDVGCRILLSLDQALEHFGDALILVSPVAPLVFGYVTEVQGVS